MKQTKEIYVSPQIEVIQVENEGVIAASGNLPGVGDGGDAFSRSSTRSNYNHSSVSDLEDMIENILTTKK